VTFKTIATWVLAIFMVLAGVNHFLAAGTYRAMVPDVLPWPWAIVYVSGVAEIAGGLGLMHPRTRRAAAWGIILLLLAVFPANINMAVNDLPLGDRDLPTWALWARLPLQAVLIAWAWWVSQTRPPALHGHAPDPADARPAARRL
jgi:uncharacterized membrane protein